MPPAEAADALPAALLLVHQAAVAVSAAARLAAGAGLVLWHQAHRATRGPLLGLASLTFALFFLASGARQAVAVAPPAAPALALGLDVLAGGLSVPLALLVCVPAWRRHVLPVRSTADWEAQAAELAASRERLRRHVNALEAEANRLRAVAAEGKAAAIVAGVVARLERLARGGASP